MLVSSRGISRSALFPELLIDVRAISETRGIVIAHVDAEISEGLEREPIVGPSGKHVQELVGLYTGVDPGQVRAAGAFARKWA